MNANPHPFLQLVLSRVETALNRIEKLIWEEKEKLSVWATDPMAKPVPYEKVSQLPLHTLEAPDYWGKLYDFRWFRCLVKATTDKRVRYLRWEDESQATAWLEGCPYHGFDLKHRNCPVPAAGGDFWLESVCASPIIGAWVPLSEKGSRFDGASLYYRNEIAWNCFHGLKVLFDLAIEERFDLDPRLGRGTRRFGYQAIIEFAPPLYRKLLRFLDECVDSYDQGGAGLLLTALNSTYEALRNDDSQALRCTLMGHAHIDLVWLWPERVGELKARHTFASMNRLMESYPELRFQYSQTASYRSVEKWAPKLMDHVRARIDSGQWEATGALEVESDTLLPCGEALARSFALGQAQFTELNRGKHSRVLWLPDVFGYSGCMPQLMLAFGVDYFFTTKLSWNAINRFPYSSFRWLGQDGSEVLAHITQENGYSGEVTVSELRMGERSYRQSDVHDEFLLPSGHGDGGGGVTPEMCERARRLAHLAGLPKASWGTATDFFDRLAEVRNRLPVYQGELYFEYHRGVYTTHGALKEAFRAAERALQAVEAAHVALGNGAIEKHWWERVVFAQFHDYIPGTSVPPVYLEGVAELKQLRGEAYRSATQTLSKKEGDSCLFNPLPLPQMVNLEGDKILTLPPLSGVRIDDPCFQSEVDPVLVTGGHLTNGLVEARFDSVGRLVYLQMGERVVRLHGPAGELWHFVDKPAFCQSWDIDRQALNHGTVNNALSEIKGEVNQDGIGIITVQRNIAAKSSVILRYILRPGRNVLEVEADLNWQDEDTLLKISFPTEYTGAMARFGAPFGSILRPQRQGDPRAEAMWEVPGSRYAVVLDDSGAEGLYLVTEAKYGFSCRDGCLSLSMVRSPHHTGMDGDDYFYMYPRKLRTEPDVPLHTDIGQHKIRLALGLFTSDLARDEQPAAMAETLYTSPIAYQGLPCEGGLLGLDGGASLIPAWAQPVESGRWILRLHEVLGRHGEVRLRLAPGWGARRCSFVGQVESKEVCVLTHDFKPYEIVSLLVERSV